MQRISMGFMDIPEIKIALNISMPLIGLGTWELRGNTCTRVVKEALEIGYRHIDTAHFYENHKEIKRALEGFERKEIFLTSKFMPEQTHKETVEETCERALKELGTDYLDLYLIHYPDQKFDMIKLMHDTQSLVEKGKCRSFGVSNFTIRHLKDLFNAQVFPAVNQVEFHPYLYQENLLDFCFKNAITLVSYRTFGKGALFQNPLFGQMGKKYGKTAAQVLLRWAIEKNIPVIPKASSRKHLEENLAIFDFSLDPEDTKKLDNLENTQRFCDWDDSEFNYE